MDKKEKLKGLMIEMLDFSHENTLKKVDVLLNSGAFDLDSWDEKMTLPKSLVAAIMVKETQQYYGLGTGNEKKIQKDINNFSYFI